MIRMKIFTVIFLLSTVPFLSAAEPIRLHPGNPHYLLYKEKPVVLITSAEHYGALLNYDFDFVPYLKELQSKGMNLTRTFSGVYCEDPAAFNIEKNTLAPRWNKLICPWARSDVSGYAYGGNKFDLDKWDNAYFERLKRFMAEAEMRDVIVEFVFFCPFYKDSMWDLSPMNAKNNINGFSHADRKEVYALKDKKVTELQEKMVRKIVFELNDFDNLYYEICNEPYFGGVTEEWQNLIADTIHNAELSLPKKHLIAKNIANGSGVVPNPNPLVSICNYHYAFPPNAIQQNFSLNKVIGYDESGFKGESDTVYRGHAWAFMMAGGGIFNNLDYSFTPDYEKGTAKVKAPGGGSAALRSQLKILRNFIEEFDFIHMTPMASVIKKIKGDKKTQGWVLGKSGEEYAIYLLNGNHTTLHLDIPSGIYQAAWIDTLTGETIRKERVTHQNGEMVLQSPWYSDDIALQVRRAQ